MRQANPRQLNSKENMDLQLELEEWLSYCCLIFYICCLMCSYCYANELICYASHDTFFLYFRFRIPKVRKQ